jgi:hypothetical protein
VLRAAQSASPPFKAPTETQTRRCLDGVLAAAQPDGPSGRAEDRGPDESEPRELTEEGRKTLEILRTEKLDSIELDPAEPRKGFELVKAALSKRGVTIRLKHCGDPKSKHRPGGPLALRNIPLDKFMKYFDQWAWWGWILYPDGSITYFDGQCACTWPKDGR